MKQGLSRIDSSPVEVFKSRGMRVFEDEFRQNFTCSFVRFKEPITWIALKILAKLTQEHVVCKWLSNLQRTIPILIVFVFDAGTVPVPSGRKKEKGRREEVKNSVPREK